MSDETPKEFKTQFTRSAFCRTLKVDGAWGGITPQGNIHCAVFTERWNLPSRTVLEFKEGEPIATETPVEHERALIREIEADLFLTLASATSLRTWLDAQITTLSQLEAQE